RPDLVALLRAAAKYRGVVVRAAADRGALLDRLARAAGDRRRLLARSGRPSFHDQSPFSELAASHLYRGSDRARSDGRFSGDAARSVANESHAAGDPCAE